MHINKQISPNIAHTPRSSYAQSMKKLIAITLISLFSFTLHAGLYKGLDEAGNVVYSDTPFENSKKMTPPPISVVDAPKVEVKKKAEEVEDKSEAVKYTRFQITAPTNQQVMWNSDALSVSMALAPALNVGGGDYIALLLDGKTVVKRSASQFIQLPRVDRGEHKVQALIRNKQGKVVKRTRAVTFHAKQSVAIRKGPR